MSKKFEWFSKEEISSWPKNHKKCRRCNKIKPFDEFHKHKNCLFGINTICSICRGYNAKVQWQHNQSNRQEYILWNSAKSRAKNKNIEFNIKIDDIKIPKYCPVFGVEMIPKTNYAPSLDRIDSSKGYVIGNISVISLRANMLKNNATLNELKMIVKWLDTGCEIVDIT
jgi:hypothetical protein